MKSSLFIGASIAALAVVASPAAAQDEAVSQDQTSVDGSAEGETDATIVVTGIRGSIQDALRIKRNADAIMDSIVAEDIGKLPDVNVAEALQRVPGVTVGRDSGEGRSISVRGLDGSFNVTTVNGRRLASEDPGRNFSYDVLASELVGRVDVIKSSQARLHEGGIGAVVDVRTLRPLDLNDDVLQFSAFGVYDELSDQVNPRLSGVVSRTFADDTIGILLSANYNKRDLRQEQFLVTEYDRNFTVSLYQGGPDEVTALTGATIPRAVILERRDEERERYGGTFALQWRPSDRLEVSVDALYSVYNTTNNSNILGIPTDQGNPIFFEQPTTIDFEADGNNNVTGVTLGDDGDPNGPFTRSEFAFVDNEVLTTPRVTDTFLVGGNVRYDISNDFTSSLDVYYSEANRDDNGDSFRLQSRTAVNTLNFSFPEGQEFPTINFSEPIGSEFPRTIAFLESSGEDVRDTIFEIKLDNVWEVGGVLDVVRFGAGYSDQTKRNDVFRSTAIDTYFEGKAGDDFFGLGDTTGIVDGQPFTVTVDAISPIGDSGFPFERFRSFVVPDSVFSNSVTNFLSSTDAPGLPTSFNGIDLGSYLDFLRSVGQVADGTNEDDFDLLNAIRSPVESYSVGEETYYGYAETDFVWQAGDVDFFLNLGLRIVHTEQTSEGTTPVVREFFGRFTNDILGVRFADDAAPISQTTSYTEVLPSLNFRANLTEDLLVRLSAARVFSRAPIGDLRFALDEPNFRAGGFGARLRAGNPDLEPFRANQVDATVEWYYSDTSALLFGAFYKDIDTFIANGERSDTITLDGPFTCTVNFCVPGQDVSFTFNLFGPFNGEGGSIKGIEFSWQQDLSDFANSLDGFGFQFNATYADSSTNLTDSFGNFLPLENQSEFSYNLIGYYENESFGARLAYNWRDEYLLTSGADPIFHSPIGWLDASLYYQVSDNVSLNIYGSNLLDTKDQATYGREEGPFNNFVNFVSFTGRQLGVGLRAKF